MSDYIFKTGDTGKTRDGRPYRVLATDLQGSHPLAAAISFGEDECAQEFTAAGTRYKMFLSGEDLLPPTRTVVVEKYIIYFQSDFGEVSTMFCGEEDKRSYSDLATLGGRKHLRTVKITETFELPQGDNK